MKRRQLLAAVAVGGIGAVVTGTSALAGTSIPVAPAAVAAAADSTIEPVFGAGLYDVDPSQGDVSQSPNVVVTGDIAVMPVDWSF